MKKRIQVAYDYDGHPALNPMYWDFSLDTYAAEIDVVYGMLATNKFILSIYNTLEKEIEGHD